MGGELSTAMLRQAAKMAARQMQMQHRLTQAFRARYGVTYSDVDCDQLIEVLDYQGGDITLAEADAAMEACGAPRLLRQESGHG